MIISYSTSTSYDNPNLKDETTQGMLIDFSSLKLYKVSCALSSVVAGRKREVNQIEENASYLVRTIEVLKVATKKTVTCHFLCHSSVP